MIDDDDTGGVPRATEPVDSGGFTTESGRHVNRNIVSRRRETDAPHDLSDQITPIRPRPDLDDQEAPERSAAPRAIGVPRGVTDYLARGRAVLQLDSLEATPRGEATDPAYAGRGAPSGVSAGEPPAPPAILDPMLRAAAILGGFAIGAIGLAQPTSVLRGGVVWLVFLVLVLAGWGTIVARIARISPSDLGQRAALGVIGYLGVAGPLIAAGVLTRPVILLLICVGYAGFAWHEATARVPTWRRIWAGVAFLRARPALASAIVAMALIAAVRAIGAVAALDRNPWDDDLVYTPLVKRLLDAGDLVEPFSFRRLSAYGGQTALHALAAARGSLANVHLIDQGLGFVLVMLAIVGHARERRTAPVWTALIALVMLLIPETTINTASYWTGVVVFVALYRCAVREQWALVGLAGAAACTLRQNYLAPVVVFAAAVLASRLVTQVQMMPWREAVALERRVWARVAGVATVAIVPWWIAAYLSSATFLFPIVDGTWNHGLSLKPPAISLAQELAYLLAGCLDTAPIVVIPILALAMMFVRDRRAERPLTALTIASAVGLVLVIHGFLGTDSFHIWRYAFGFAAALTIVMVLEIGGERDAHIELAPLGHWLVLAALVMQLVIARGSLAKQVASLAGDLREAAAVDRRGDPSASAERRRYEAMQATLPAGARAVVMVDDPALLDYQRNRLANLDTPGFASPGTQLPAFAGAEPLRSYLVAHGYRHAVFVRSERSRYFFRRDFWRWRIFTDAELFQIMSAYAIDAIDSFAELATTTRVIYDHDGLVVLDLATPQRPASKRVVEGDEPTRRTAWTRAFADREGLHDAWSLTTRADLRFEDGTGTLRYLDPEDSEPGWGPRSAQRADLTARGKPILPVQRRVHLRVRGTRDMRLVLRAAIGLETVYTHPRLDVSLDGELLASVVADRDGRYAVDATVPSAALAGGWHDLYLVFSSIAEPGRDLRELRIARLEAVEWIPR